MPFTPAEESAIRQLLRTAQLGFIGGGDEANNSDEIASLRQQIAGLNHQRNTGNVIGGMLRTEIAPGAYTVGPYRQDLDATHPIAFDLWIPDYLLRIKRCQMRIKPAAVRSSLAVASSSESTPSGGGSTSGASSSSTTPSGGSGTGGSSNSLDGHHHAIAIYRTDGDPGFTSRFYDLYDGSTIPPTSQTLGVHLETESAADIITGPNVQTATGSHTHTTPNHTHNISHTHTTPAHTHPAHSHTLTLAIAEGGSATTLEFTIDGVDRTVALGGPWNAAAVVDITDYLINARMEPVAGAHPVIIESASVGAVEVWFDFYVVVKAIQ